jgi:hypothetical protein
MVGTALRRGVVEATDFGAIGDGTTDDTAALTAAIAALTATGGTVLIPSGTFKITSPLALRGRTTFTGAGMYATVIKAVGCHGLTFDGGNGTPTTILHASYYTTVRDLAVQGDFTAGKNGVNIERASEWSFERVRICDFAAIGMRLFWVVNWSLRDCVIRDNNGHGLVVNDAGNNGFVSGGSVKNNNGWGIYAQGNTGSGAEQTQVTDLRLQGVDVEGNLEGGLNAYEYVSVLDVSCHFEANYANNTTTQTGATRPAVTPVRTVGKSISLGNAAGGASARVDGTSIHGSRFSTIEGGDLTSGFHIFLDQANGTHIDGNTFHGPGEKPIRYDLVSNRNVNIGPANFYQGGEFDRYNDTYLRGSHTFNGTTGRIVGLDYANNGGPSYHVRITPTAPIAGRWYVVKEWFRFTVYSTDAADAGSFDWEITVETF